MGRGGKVGSKPYRKRRIRSEDKGSDESDEDYLVGEDEEFNDSEEYCSSLPGEVSDESLGEFEDEEDEEVKTRKVGRSKGGNGFPGRKKNWVRKASKKRKVSYKVEDDEEFEDGEELEESSGEFEEDEEEEKVDKVSRSKGQNGFPGREKNGVGKAHKKRRFSYKVEDDEESEVGEESDESFGEFEEDEEDKEEEKVRKVSRSRGGNGFPGRKKIGFGKPSKKRRVSYKVEDDEEFEDDDDDDDEEFAPDEIDLDEEDEFAVKKKKIKKVGRPSLRENVNIKGRNRKRNSKFMKKPIRKKPTKRRRLQGKSAVRNNGTFTDPVVKERSKKSYGQRKRRFMKDSDSDFMSSVSSDFEYTISEEEREQVREASELCRDLFTNLRNSSSRKKLNKEEVFCQQRKPLGRKGKEKVEDFKNEGGKQVCGICLSDEGEKTVRGTLNCCSHYFCFACIMEWSKVESRCPLCKQRFTTISKPTRSNTGFELRTMVIQVAERDQVYQPSEEEVRGYLDPYENLVCTECHRGGDDALMLLCDICDSPAHTYCVGLDHEVPEGNWYCEGCRPTALGSSNPRAPCSTPNQITINDLSGRLSPVESVREAIDLNTEYVPETPVTQGTGFFSSPRHLVVDAQAAASVSGAGVSTVSERRRIHRQIHHILNNRLSQLDGRTNGVSATTLVNDLLGSQIDWGRDLASQHATPPERLASHQTFSHRRLQNDFTPSVQSRDLLSASSSRSRGQTSTSADGSARMLQAGHAGISRGINSRLGYEQLHPCSNRSSIGDDGMSPHRHRDVSHFNAEKEQVQSMVRSHLKSLSREIDLGYGTFKDIARSSTHTILAACGLEHRESEVYPVQPPSTCNHVEGMVGGEMSLMQGCCPSCFDSYARHVVREIANRRVHHPSYRVRD